MNSLLPFLAAMAVAVVAGCGGGGGGGTSAVAPTISALSYVPTAVYVNDGGGQTTVNGTFYFSDPEGDLSTTTLQVLDASGQPVFSQVIPISGASGVTSGVIQGSVTVTTVAAGNFTIQIYVTDSHGLDSNRLSGVFRVAVFPWVAKAAMPTPRLQFATANVGGLIYVIGGQDASSTATPKPPLTTVEVYDPASDSWLAAPPLPQALSSMMASVVNGRIYVMGGVPDLAPSTTAVEEYDPVTQTWTTMATAMPSDRYSAATAVYNGLVYVAGGSGAGVMDSTTLLIYDPAGDSWTAGSPMSQTRTGAAAAQINGQVVVYGGKCSTCVANGGYLGSVEQYDIGMDSWSGRSAGTPRTDAGIELVNGLVYAVGGSDTSGPLDLVEMYDDATNSWTTKTAMPVTIGYARVETVNNRVYVFDTGNTLEYTPGNDIK